MVLYTQVRRLFDMLTFRSTLSLFYVCIGELDSVCYIEGPDLSWFEVLKFIAEELIAIPSLRGAELHIPISAEKFVKTSSPRSAKIYLFS